MSDLLEALRRLERAATEVQREHRRSDPSPQWASLDSVLIHARGVLFRADSAAQVDKNDTPRTDAHLAHLNLPGGRKIGIPDATVELLRELEHLAKRWQQIADQRAIEVADLRCAKSADGSVTVHGYSFPASLMPSHVGNSPAPRINAMPLIKRLKDQRDEVAEVLRELVYLKMLKDRNHQNAFGIWIDADDQQKYKERQPKAWLAAKAALEKCPSYEQQLRNVAEGIGMTYEELTAALSDRPESGSKHG